MGNNNLRDETILFAKHHIQQAFGVEPNILLGQEKWLHTDENGILWRVKAYRFFHYDWTEKGGEVLAQRSFNGGSAVVFGCEKLYTGTLWSPRQPNWDLEFPMIKNHAGRAQKVAEWVYLNLLARGTEMPSDDFKMEFNATKWSSEKYRALVSVTRKGSRNNLFDKDARKMEESLRKAIRDLRVETCGEPEHPQDGNIFDYYNIFPNDPISYEEQHGISPIFFYVPAILNKRSEG